MAGRNLHSDICCWALIRSIRVVTSRLPGGEEGRREGENQTCVRKEEWEGEGRK